MTKDKVSPECTGIITNPTNHKSVWCSAAVKSQLLLSAQPSSTQEAQRGKLVSDTWYSRKSNYLLHVSMMNLVMKLTCVNMSLEGPQWCDMEKWEKILSFRSISASLGSAIVTLLQNIYMTWLLIFLSSCNFLCLTHDMGLWWYPHLYGKTLVANPGYQLQHIKWAAAVKVRKHLLS